MDVDVEDYPSPVVGGLYAGPPDLTRDTASKSGTRPRPRSQRNSTAPEDTPWAATAAADVVAAAPDALPSSTGKLPIYAYLYLCLSI